MSSRKSSKASLCGFQDWIPAGVYPRAASGAGMTKILFAEIILAKKFIKIFILILVIAVAVWAKRSGFFEIVLKMIHDLGPWAAPAFLAVYILSCLLFFPSVVMTCAAGILFPVPLGIFLSLLGTALGSVVALLIGRYGLRSLIQKKAAGNRQFQKLDEAIRREGWKIAVLARLTPVFPFSIGNYLFGATPISAWVYALTAFIGTIPSASVYVFVGHMSGGAVDRARTPLEWALLAAGILATIILSIYLKGFFTRIFGDSKKILPD